MPVAKGTIPCSLKGLADIEQVPLFPFLLVILVDSWKTAAAAERKLESPFIYALDTHPPRLRETPQPCYPDLYHLLYLKNFLVVYIKFN